MQYHCLNIHACWLTKYIAFLRSTRYITWLDAADTPPDSLPNYPSLARISCSLLNPAFCLPDPRNQLSPVRCDLAGQLSISISRSPFLCFSVSSRRNCPRFATRSIYFTAGRWSRSNWIEWAHLYWYKRPLIFACRCFKNPSARIWLRTVVCWDWSTYALDRGDRRLCFVDRWEGRGRQRAAIWFHGSIRRTRNPLLIIRS
jgi:hypothetical protein